MFKKYFKFISIFLSIIVLLFGSPSRADYNLYFPIKSKKYYISSEYGYRYLEYAHFHNGIDIPLVEGTHLYALSDGTVSFIGYISGYGKCIILKYDNGYKSLYGHISPKFIVSTGQRVKAKDHVAYVGPKYLPNGKLNGFTTGPHLHFTLYKNNKLVNPSKIKFNKST